MNRKDNISEEIVASFIKVTNEMSKEDKELFYRLILEDDYSAQDELLRKYNYMVVKPIEHSLSEIDAEDFANTLLKNGLSGYKKYHDAVSLNEHNAWKETPRISGISLDESEEILSRAHSMESRYYSSDGLKNIFDAFNGENATLIMNAAMIADLVGCLKIRNDLMVLYSTMLRDAANKKAIDIFYKKKVISDDRSAARKGKTNRHLAETLEIAEDTWAKYPNASLAGLSEDISIYLRNAWNDAPVTGTVKTWLKNSGLYPEGELKNRDFKLVLKNRE